MTGSSRIVILIASAVCYALAFPPLGLVPLALAGVGGLIWSLAEVTPRGAFARGLLWGLLVFGTGLSWLWNIFHAFCVPLWLLLALFPALFAWLVARARMRGLHGLSLAVYTALAWCGTEFIRCELMPLRFPWMNLGLALEPWPLVSLIGVYGLGLVAMLAVAGCIHAGWKTVWLVPVVAAGWLMEIQLIKPIGVQVAAVQAEMAPLQRYIELTKQASYSARLIVWPEYAVPRDMRATNDISQMQQAADNARSIIVFGTQTRLGGAKWQNTALTVNRDGILGEHGKNHTVHLFDDGERGTTQGVIETSVGKIGTPICFDCDFHDVARRMTLNGAEFFAVPSMDAASWGEKQHLQHSQLFRVRAAENRRAFVVAASSGISQIISPTGRTTASLPPMQQGVVEGLIIPNKQLTHFTRWGWLTPWLALGALAAWSFYLGAARSLISTR